MYKKLQCSFFPPQSLKPTGWLKHQLQIQAEGLSGNLDKVWKYVKDSAWIGGSCEGWERVPYWLDGFIPLAYLLNDDKMILRAKKYIDAILSRQQEDGWICPCSYTERGDYDTWAVLLILKVLVLYADASGDERILPAAERCLKNLSQHLNVHTLRNWGAARWFEGLISIFWVYERTHEQWLLDLAKKLKIQGFNWREIFESGFIDSCREGWDFYSHAVNIAMMLKSEALMSLISNLPAEEFAEEVLNYLESRHSTAAGHFTGDENLSGDSPIQGTELCGVVETMYSYEWLFAVTENPKWLDKLEQLAFNALPAATSPDMWSHQYDQMTNQVACFPMSKQPFRTNNNVAHTFGLEPNFGCCTANFGQGWPKFALSSFMHTNTGIACCTLTPGTVETEIDGVAVHCELITDYPFRDSLICKIITSSPVSFTLSLRIPAAASHAEVDNNRVDCGKFYNITREWSGTQIININLSFDTKIVQRPNNMVCVWRGPLLYSIAIEEKWERVEYTQNGAERKYPYCDYYIYPVSKWNYALTDRNFCVKENSFTAAFDTKNPPVVLTAEMSEIEWDFNNGHCDPLPKNTVPLGTPQKVDLIPYGCTNLRLTEFPALFTL